MAANLVTSSDISVTWDSIGGLSDVISEIKETIILLFKKGYLFESSSLLAAPKGNNRLSSDLHTRKNCIFVLNYVRRSFVWTSGLW